MDLEVGNDVKSKNNSRKKNSSESKQESNMFLSAIMGIGSCHNQDKQNFVLKTCPIAAYETI